MPKGNFAHQKISFLHPLQMCIMLRHKYNRKNATHIHTKHKMYSNMLVWAKSTLKAQRGC